MTGRRGAGDRSHIDPLEWPCSQTFHILPQCFLPGVAESPPVLSESTVPIHGTNHSSASWKPHLTATVAMGVLPCEHPRRGTGEVRLRLETHSGLWGPFFSEEICDYAKEILFYCVNPDITNVNHSECFKFWIWKAAALRKEMEEI